MEEEIIKRTKDHNEVNHDNLVIKNINYKIIFLFLTILSIISCVGYSRIHTTQIVNNNHMSNEQEITSNTSRMLNEPSVQLIENFDLLNDSSDYALIVSTKSSLGYIVSINEKVIDSDSSDYGTSKVVPLDKTLLKNSGNVIEIKVAPHKELSYADSSSIDTAIVGINLGDIVSTNLMKWKT